MRSLVLAALLVLAACASPRASSPPRSDPDDAMSLVLENHQQHLEVERLENERARPEADVAAIDSRLAVLREDLARRRRRLRALESPSPLLVPSQWLVLAPSPAVPLPPRIEAQVVGFLGDPNAPFVVLSAGEREGVRPRVRFSVYRGSTWIAKVEVLDVRPGQSAARVLFTREGEAVRLGDMGATRLD